MTFDEKIIEWIGECAALDKFTPQLGELRENGMDGKEFFVCFYRDGGRQTGPSNAFPRVKFWLYGPHDSETTRDAMSDVGEAADKLFDYATGPMQTCGFISSKILGGIIGPKFTENGRTVYGLTVEFID